MKILKYIITAPFNIAFITIFVGYFLLLFPVYYVLIKIGKRWSHDGVQILNKFWAAISSLLILSPTLVRNKHKIKGKGPLIYVANHSSYWDIPVLSLVLPHRFRFLGKVELVKVPLFGLMFREVHIPVNRGNRIEAVKSLDKAREKLASGVSVMIFAEGTIPDKKTVILAPFKDGAFRLAQETGVPLVPVTVIGSDRALPDSKIPWFNPATPVKVIFDDPIPTKGLSPEEVNTLKQQIYDLIYSRLTQKSV